MTRLLLLLALLGCESEPKAPITCAEKAIDRYAQCMTYIRIEDDGCFRLAQEILAECRPRASRPKCPVFRRAYAPGTPKNRIECMCYDENDPPLPDPYPTGGEHG